MKRIAVLASHAGFGHQSASAVLAEHLRELTSERVEFRIDDAFGDAWGLRRLAGAYRRVTTDLCWLYDLVWSLSNGRTADRVIRWAAWRLLRRRALMWIARWDPDLIIVCHPLYASHVIALAAGKAKREAPTVVTLVTDPLSVHRSWVSTHCDAVLATTAESALEVQRQGVSPERVRVVPFPVAARFQRRSGSAEHRRASAGLDPDRRVVVLTGGGAGSGDLEALTESVLRWREEHQVVVASGTNGRLSKRLSRVRQDDLIVLTGNADMQPFFAAADVVIGKAGPSTIHECAATGVPMLLTREVGGQERGNIHYAVTRGWARPLGRSVDADAISGAETRHDPSPVRCGQALGEELSRLIQRISPEGDRAMTPSEPGAHEA